MDREKITERYNMITRGDRGTFTDTFKLKVDTSTSKRETIPKDAGRFPGQKIVAFDAVPTREGVMNGGFKPWDELVKAAPTLDMAWVTKDHPPADWVYSADEGIGFCRNTKCDHDNKRLTTELCIFDTEENSRWIQAVELGIKDENSVGFTCKTEMVPELEALSTEEFFTHWEEGTLEEIMPKWDDEEFGPRAYDHIQTEIFFNHDAILDAGDGACGSDYGCSVGTEAGDKKEETMNEKEILEQLSDCRKSSEDAVKRHEELAGAVAEILDYIKANEAPTEEEPEEEAEEEEAEEEAPADDPAPEEEVEPVEEEPADEEPEDEEEEDDEPEEESDSETITVEVKMPGADAKPAETLDATARLKYMSVGGRQPDGTYPGEKHYTNKE